MADALSEGIIDPAGASTLLLIAAVWVNPVASDASSRDDRGPAQPARGLGPA